MKSTRLYLLFIFVFAWCFTGCEDENYSKIVFMRGEPGSIWGNLYLIDYTGDNLVQLTDSGMDAYPRWSPEKDKIVFNRRVGGAGGNWDIYTINPDGTGDTALITGETDDMYPSWSPDGTRIAFLRLHDSVPDGNAIIVYNLGRRVEETFDDFAILGVHLSLFDPCWSPGGDEIAFYGIGVANAGIYTITYSAVASWGFLKANGSQPDWYAGSGGQEEGKIVYVLNGIRVMNGNGTSDRLVVDSGENPNWSVKFNEIVFQKLKVSGAPPYTNQIYKVQENGTLLVQLTDDPLKEHKYPHW